MTTAQLLSWYLVAALGMIGSALFSGLETGVYTLNHVRLHVLAHRRRPSALLLERLVRHPNELLGTLLIANNMANYAATLALAALLAARGYEGWAQVAINAAILTPLLFVFGEVLPKDLFRAHSDRLTYPFAPLLIFMRHLLTWTGALPLVSLVSRSLQKLLHAEQTPDYLVHPRRHVTLLLREGVGQGRISAYQSDMMDRVLQIDRLTVADVLVPWQHATVLRADQPPEAVAALANRAPFNRMPLVDHHAKPVGLINVNHVLRFDPATCPALTALALPLESLPPDISLHDALSRFRAKGLSLALVGSPDQPLGIVTTKNLVEPIVGQLWAW